LKKRPVLQHVEYFPPGTSKGAIFVLHGGLNHRHWIDSSPHFVADLTSAGYEIISFDLRGQGENQTLPPPRSISHMADDVIALANSLGYATFFIIGASWGGLIAQSLAAQYPMRVRKLILACTFAKLDFPRYQKMFWPAKGAGWLSPRVLAKTLMGKKFFSIARADEIYRDYLLGTSPKQTQAFTNAAAAFDGSSLGSKIIAPTLVVIGERDNLVAVKDARRLANGIPGARMEVICNGCDHNILSGGPWDQQLVACFVKFLDK
jgi:pimeloyl-ACP methyl ester carboxylesterase